MREVETTVVEFVWKLLNNIFIEFNFAQTNGVSTMGSEIPFALKLYQISELKSKHLMWVDWVGSYFKSGILTYLVN